MRNRKVFIAALVIGILLVVTSVVIPLVITLASNPAVNPETSIIGGAGAPTFLLLRQFFRHFSWLALVGAILTVSSIVGLTVRKK